MRGSDIRDMGLFHFVWYDLWVTDSAGFATYIGCAAPSGLLGRGRPRGQLSPPTSIRANFTPWVIRYAPSSGFFWYSGHFGAGAF